MNLAPVRVELRQKSGRRETCPAPTTH